MTEQQLFPPRRIYRGPWRGIVKWLRMPEPPGPPARFGKIIMSARPAPGFLRYLKLWFWIVAAGKLAFEIALVLALGLTASQFISPWLGAGLVLPVLALLSVPDVLLYVGVHLRYDATWYVLGERALRIRRGVWTVTEITITYENVQNVTVRSGPVQRLFGVSTIEIETAGSGGSSEGGAHGQRAGVANQARIEGVANAEQVRDLIMSRVRASRSAGLGDDQRDPAPRSAPSARLTSAHVDALREIRDLVANRG